MKYLTFVLLVLVLTCCTLNSTQETSLNQHVSKYIKAKNNCLITGVIGFTYPAYVKELKQTGNKEFMRVFNCNDSTSLQNKLSIPIYRAAKTSEKMIQVKYELDDSQTSQNSHFLYAISEDDGKTWYFLPGEVYNNVTSCTKLKRLFN